MSFTVQPDFAICGVTSQTNARKRIFALCPVDTYAVSATNRKCSFENSLHYSYLFCKNNQLNECIIICIHKAVFTHPLYTCFPHGIAFWNYLHWFIYVCLWKATLVSTSKMHCNAENACVKGM